MSDIPMSERRLFYGWVVVAAAFLVTFVGFGTAYTFGSFASSLQSAFGASRGSVSAIFGATGFLYFSAGLVTGPLADRFGVRPLAAAGMMLVGAGAIGAGLAPTLSGVFAAYVLGVGLLHDQVEPTPTADLNLHDIALEIGLSINHSPYDTLHVAFALAIGAEKVVVADGPFVTAMRAHPDPTLASILMPLAARASGGDA
jgi:MFS family permease